MSFFGWHGGEMTPVYNRCGEEKKGSGFFYDERVLLTCFENKASWENLAGSEKQYGAITNNITGYSTGGENCTMYIFALHEPNAGVAPNPNTYIAMKLYSFKIYEGNTLVRDFVPVAKNTDGTYGLLDVVGPSNHKFYPMNTPEVEQSVALVNDSETLNNPYVPAGIVLQHNHRYYVTENTRVDASAMPGVSAIRVPIGAAVIINIAAGDLGAPAAKKYDIEFRNVKFGYNEDKIIIKNFSATAGAGKKVAIVGPTGAGKTTMVNLLMRFYETNEGSIFIDGHDTKDMSRAEVHSLFGMVLQETWLKEESVKNNLKMNKPDASDEEIREAAEIAQAIDFIEEKDGKITAFECKYGNRSVKIPKDFAAAYPEATFNVITPKNLAEILI